MYRSLFTLFRKQRLRWHGDLQRQRAVDAAEWQSTQFLVAELARAVGAVGGGRKLLLVVSLLWASVRLGVPSLVKRGLTFGSRRRQRA